MEPPSATIKQRLVDLNGREVTENFVQDVAKDVLLTSEEVKIWLDHLVTVFENRRRGAAKSAATRKAKQQKHQQQETAPAESDNETENQEYYCAHCQIPYKVSTARFWVGCDSCDKWYCGPCEGLTREPTVEIYFCTKCRN